jgi:hypothetical protein
MRVGGSCKRVILYNVQVCRWCVPRVQVRAYSSLRNTRFLGGARRGTRYTVSTAVGNRNASRNIFNQIMQYDAFMPYYVHRYVRVQPNQTFLLRTSMTSRTNNLAEKNGTFSKLLLYRTLDRNTVKKMV